ncbi:MAG: GNAT family N-acetyltransferase [Butyrivibrio sp.]|nr:GNAT family N-acetyltransferase [Butyrivibrio sp.]
MTILAYYDLTAAEQAHWREAISASDWRGGQNLYRLLAEDELRTPEWIGEGAQLFLLTEGERQCGFCTLAGNDDVPDTPLKPWVGFVYTFPEWRGGHNFGTLLAHVVERARTEGHTAVYVSTDHIGLYEHYGFVFREQAKDLWGGDTRVYELDFGWMLADETERQQGLPARAKAERILEASNLMNPGPWREHSYCVALAAERIARACGDIDPECAYLSGLLHDIGRRFGHGHLRHVYDGWKFMERLGYPAAGRICLTHSFKRQFLEDYVGNHDLTPAEEQETVEAMTACRYGDMDRLIQLCDSICGATVVDIEERMLDVKRRYGGFYPQDKWDANIALLHDFERRTGGDIYRIARGEKGAS